MTAAVTVTDCERVQSDWFQFRARALGGSSWIDGGMRWTDGPDGLNVMFPAALDIAALRRGVEKARADGRKIVGAWLGTGVDPAPLAEAGFERGWAPWWMTADLADVPPPDDPRVRLEQYSTDYGGEHAGYGSLLAITRLDPARAWYAAAHENGRFAGRSWSFLDAGLAGIFDMSVWPRFQRRGLGTALLAAVCAAARAAGAEHAVLNATPEGEQLYRTCGFRRIGEGITWWCHLDED